MTAIPPGEYRLMTHRVGTDAVAGVLVGERVHPLAEVLADTHVPHGSVLAALERWPAAHAAIAEAIDGLDPERGRPFDELEVLAPVLYPRAIFCAGANYWDHMEEMEGTIDRAKRAKDPWFFLKTSAHSVVGPGTAVRAPTASHELDWEAELAVVIGTHARDVAAEQAQDVIAGYTIVDDLSARDLMTRPDRPPAMAFDWIGQKCFDGAAPMGPWLTPAAYVQDVHDLDVRLWRNDELKQDSNTNQLIHDVFEQIEWLSHQLTLMPGDVIATGTPAGVGRPRGEYLHPGDVVRIEIEGCGTLTHSIG